jgi:hypothetical protein
MLLAPPDTIDHQAAHAVRFAENQSARAARMVVTKLVPKVDGSFEPATKKSPVECLAMVPGVEPHSQSAATVI